MPVGSIPLGGAKIFSIQGPKKGHLFCMGLYSRTRYPASRCSFSSCFRMVALRLLCRRYYLLSGRDEHERGAWLLAIKNVSGVPITSVVRQSGKTKEKKRKGKIM